MNGDPRYRLIKCYGLKRSGNHAIINWLLLKANFLFYNNIVHIAPILRGEQEHPESTPYRTWLRSRLSFREWFNVCCFRRPVIISLEDHFLTFSPFHGQPRATANLVIARDPANMFASRTRKASNRSQGTPHNPAYPRSMDHAMQRVIDLWKVYAHEVLGDTNILPNKVPIYYNAWFTDELHRKDTCDRLGVSYVDSGFTMVRITEKAARSMEPRTTTTARR